MELYQQIIDMMQEALYDEAQGTFTKFAQDLRELNNAITEYLDDLDGSDAQPDEDQAAE